MLHIKCLDPWYSKIKTCEKPVEGRKGKEKDRNLSSVDTVRFTNGDDHFDALVLKVEVFDTLVEYLHFVGLEKALPGIKTMEEGINIYHQWSTEDEISRLGFLGIWVRPIHS